MQFIHLAEAPVVDRDPTLVPTRAQRVDSIRARERHRQLALGPGVYDPHDAVRGAVTAGPSRTAAAEAVFKSNSFRFPPASPVPLIPASPPSPPPARAPPRPTRHFMSPVAAVDGAAAAWARQHAGPAPNAYAAASRGAMADRDLRGRFRAGAPRFTHQRVGETRDVGPGAYDLAGTDEAVGAVRMHAAAPRDVATWLLPKSLHDAGPASYDPVPPAAAARAAVVPRARDAAPGTVPITTDSPAVTRYDAARAHAFLAPYARPSMCAVTLKDPAPSRAPSPPAPWYEVRASEVVRRERERGVRLPQTRESDGYGRVDWVGG
ncbi:hypothetical protein GGF32_004242 [Allomyces javanicus]|nr:hypothetical protein GGF32_004242 [Allomyces javanicus]